MPDPAIRLTLVFSESGGADPFLLIPIYDN
jgi:hypothetical protein